MAESWVEIVGYQHEAVHDGALVQLLSAKAEIALPVASALLGEDVSDVISARRQGRVGRAQADVVAEFRVGTSTRLLAIETKVDSQSNREQLERTTTDGDEVVMLALGNSAMRTCTVASAYPDEVDWRVIDIGAWSSILGGLPPLPPLLEQYRGAVAREAQEHADARQAIHGNPAGDFSARLGDELLAWAWIDETWRSLRRTADAGHLYAHKAISGPILFWEDSWRELSLGHGGFYLDLMAEGEHRSVVLKAADVPSENRAALADATAASAPDGSQPPRRRSLRGGTFRVLVWDVTGRAPAASAAVALEARAYLRDVAARN